MNSPYRKIDTGVSYAQRVEMIRREARERAAGEARRAAEQAAAKAQGDPGSASGIVMPKAGKPEPGHFLVMAEK